MGWADGAIIRKGNEENCPACLPDASCLCEAAPEERGSGLRLERRLRETELEGGMTVECKAGERERSSRVSKGPR